MVIIGWLSPSCFAYDFKDAKLRGKQDSFLKTVDSYIKTCEGGDILGCTSLRKRMHQDDEGYERGLVKTEVIPSRKAACDFVVSDDFDIAKEIYLSGENFTEAAKLYIKSCESGNMFSCTNLANLYIKGQGVEQNSTKAVQLAQKSCDSGNVHGCVYLGILYGKGEGDIKKDSAKAAKLYEQGCNGGSRLGCFNLGSMYAQGESVNKDITKAVELYEKSCDGNRVVLGCAELGAMYLQGREIKQDYVKASKFFSKACEEHSHGRILNNLDSCNILGMINLKGLGIAPNYSKALEVFKTSCTFGSSSGCILEASMYEGNLDIERNGLNALERYQRVCEKKDSFACAAYQRMQLITGRTY